MDKDHPDDSKSQPSHKPASCGSGKGIISVPKQIPKRKILGRSADGATGDAWGASAREAPLITANSAASVETIVESKEHFHVNIVDVYEGGFERHNITFAEAIKKGIANHCIICSKGERHDSGKDDPNEAKNKLPEEIEAGKRKIRWVHLPFTSMAWAELLVSRIIQEDCGSKEIAATVFDDCRWRQLVVDPSDYSSLMRFIRPACLSFKHGEVKDVEDKVCRERCKEYQKDGNNVALFMPYLHWDTNTKMNTICDAVRKYEKRLEANAKAGENAPQQPNSNRLPQTRSTATNRTSTDIQEASHRVQIERDTSHPEAHVPKDATSPQPNIRDADRYLYMLEEDYEQLFGLHRADAATSWSTKKETNEQNEQVEKNLEYIKRIFPPDLIDLERKLEDHDGQSINSGNSQDDSSNDGIDALHYKMIETQYSDTSSLHIRRNLDYYMYSPLLSNDEIRKDKTQVIRKHMMMRVDKEKYKDASPDPRDTILVVDQLWLWILGGNILVTCSDKRWSPEQSKESDLMNILLDKLQRNRADVCSDIESVYDLAFIVIDECTSMFFSRPLDPPNMTLSDMFFASIEHIEKEHSKKCFEMFMKATRKLISDRETGNEVKETENESVSKLRPSDNDKATNEGSGASSGKTQAGKIKRMFGQLGKFLNKAENLRHALFDVSGEMQQISDIRDILYELRSIKHILARQDEVLDLLARPWAKYLLAQKCELTNPSEFDSKITKRIVRTDCKSVSAFAKNADLVQTTKSANEGATNVATKTRGVDEYETRTLKNWYRHVSVYLDQHIRTVDEMTVLAKDVKETIQETIEMKNNQAGAFEARSSKKREQITFLFTLVAVITLPLSFFSVSARDISSDGKLSMWMIAAVAIPASFLLVLLFFLVVHKVGGSTTLGYHMLKRKWARIKTKKSKTTTSATAAVENLEQERATENSSRGQLLLRRLSHWRERNRNDSLPF